MAELRPFARLRSIRLCVFALAATTATARAQDALPLRPVAFHRATVVDVRTGRLIPEQTVIVEGNRITAIATSGTIDIPLGATLVDARGRYLIPGLWDMHVHLFNQIGPRPPNLWHLPLLVANGVTGVRDMWTTPADTSLLAELRRQIAAGTLIGPRIAATGALVDGPVSWWPESARVATPEAGREFVHQVSLAKLDFVKVYSGLPRDIYLAIADEARRIGMPIAGRVPLRVPLREAIAAGQRSVERLTQVREACSTAEQTILSERARRDARRYTARQDDSLWNRHEGLRAAQYDEARCRSIARRLAANGVYQVPALLNERRAMLGTDELRPDDERLRYVPAEDRRLWIEGADSGDEPWKDLVEGIATGRLPDERWRRWNKTMEVVQTLARARVPFMTGTDLGSRLVIPGFSVHDELQELTDAGLTTLEALRAATYNPARFLDAADSLGTVEAGKVADLVLLDDNPLADIRNVRRIRAVVVNGHLLDRNALDALLRHAERVAAGASMTGQR
ncbi:MAG TPA: amidohydrolase family protein [Gemmatimonadaceae bacterium]